MWWELVDAYYRDHTLVSQHIESYNQFVEETIPEIIEENSVIDPGIGNFRIEIRGFHLEKPRAGDKGIKGRKLYPMEARIRNRSYMADLYLDMVAIRRNVELQKQRMEVGSIPVMVKSRLCWLDGMSARELISVGEDPNDLGGYFIINGVEKVLISHDEPAPNKIMVSHSDDQKTKIVAQVFSRKGAYTGKTMVIRRKDGIWNVVFPSVGQIRWTILMRALGFTDDGEILDGFLGDKQVLNDALLNLEGSEIKTEEAAIEYIGRLVAPQQVREYQIRRAHEVIDNFLLPHIGRRPEDRKAKGYFLIRMAEMTSEVYYGIRPADDKDHLSNKRIELSGKLMETLFTFAMRSLIRDIGYQVERALSRRKKLKLQTVVRRGAFDDAIAFAMNMGVWPNRRTGVSTIHNRQNVIAPIYDLRKVKSPLSKKRKNFEAREVHGTHFGRFCPIQTPEGQACGLVKHFALLARVTTASDPEKMERVLKKMGVRLIV